jgi:hypothetical protein
LREAPGLLATARAAQREDEVAPSIEGCVVLFSQVPAARCANTLSQRESLFPSAELLQRIGDQNSTVGRGHAFITPDADLSLQQLLPAFQSLLGLFQSPNKAI